MFNRLSLTARLTALYTLVSALVLIGLGVLWHWPPNAILLNSTGTT